MNKETAVMAGILKFIAKETGETLHPENIRYFFNRLREDIKVSSEPEIDPDAILADYDQLKVQEKNELESIDLIEKEFNKWSLEHNPATIMATDLRNRGCAKTTIQTYCSVGNSYMRMFEYQPEFSLSEYYQFMSCYENCTPGTKRTYRDILKLLWEVQGLIFPLKQRRMHTPHTIMPSIPPYFTAEQIAKIINLTKKYGTPEEKYYICLSTVFAPRRIELGEITAQNFTWEGDTGMLVFNPHKHGVTRRHHIPEYLVPYLKDYSGIVKPVSSPNLTIRFWRIVNHLGLPVPKTPKREKRELREKHLRPRQHGWHAFRHGVTTALVEAGLNDTMIRDWMGWRSGNPSAPLVSVYYNAQNVDIKIQAKHPFIKLWK